MARGWESKSVEEQIASRSAEPRPPSTPPLTPAQQARRVKREALLLARARTMNSLESARDERYRALLERTLAHLDSQLAQSL